MVRRGSSLAAALVMLALVACSDGGDDAADDTAPPENVTVTVPDDADAGLGYLVLDGRPTLLQVRDCSVEPATDPATGVTTHVSIDLDDGISMAVSITRYSTPGDLETITDNVTIADNEAIVSESQRLDIAGRYQDLHAPGVLEPLLDVDGTLVTARGVFGPIGSRDGDSGLVEGSLTVRCPATG